MYHRRMIVVKHISQFEYILEIRVWHLSTHSLIIWVYLYLAQLKVLEYLGVWVFEYLNIWVLNLYSAKLIKPSLGILNTCPLVNMHEEIPILFILYTLVNNEHAWGDPNILIYQYTNMQRQKNMHEEIPIFCGEYLVNILWWTCMKRSQYIVPQQKWI